MLFLAAGGGVEFQRRLAGVRASLLGGVEHEADVVAGAHFAGREDAGVEDRQAREELHLVDGVGDFHAAFEQEILAGGREEGFDFPLDLDALVGGRRIGVQLQEAALAVDDIGGAGGGLRNNVIVVGVECGEVVAFSVDVQKVGHAFAHEHERGGRHVAEKRGECVHYFKSLCVS